jgi:hypothetical protein
VQRCIDQAPSTWEDRRSSLPTPFYPSGLAVSLSPPLPISPTPPLPISPSPYLPLSRSARPPPLPKCCRRLAPPINWTGVYEPAIGAGRLLVLARHATRRKEGLLHQFQPFSAPGFRLRGQCALYVILALLRRKIGAGMRRRLGSRKPARPIRRRRSRCAPRLFYAGGHRREGPSAGIRARCRDRKLCTRVLASALNRYRGTVS